MTIGKATSWLHYRLYHAQRQRELRDKPGEALPVGDIDMLLKTLFQRKQ